MKGIFHFAELRNCLLSIKTTFILCFGNKLIWKLAHLGSSLPLTVVSSETGVSGSGGHRACDMDSLEALESPSIDILLTKSSRHFSDCHCESQFTGKLRHRETQELSQVREAVKW